MDAVKEDSRTQTWCRAKVASRISGLCRTTLRNLANQGLVESRVLYIGGAKKRGTRVWGVESLRHFMNGGGE